MSLSLFCAIPNSNMTNTLFSLYTQNLISESTSTDTSRKLSGLGEERCRLGWARMQETPYVCVPHSPGWACRASRHREEGSWRIPHHTLQPLQMHTEDCPPPPRLKLQGTILAQRPQDKHPLKKSHCGTYFDWQFKPSTHDKHVCTRVETNLASEHHLTKREAETNGRRGQQAGHWRKQTGQTQRSKDSETKSRKGAGRETSVTPGKAVSASSLRTAWR